MVKVLKWLGTFEKKIKNIEDGVKPWVQIQIRSELKGMQTWFNDFERLISQKLADILSTNLVGIHEELAVLRAAIEYMHVRPFHLMPIIEEIIQEDMPDIWGTEKGKFVVDNDGDRPKKKGKRSKKS